MKRSLYSVQNAGIESKATYKKLGTILEHLLICVNSSFYKLDIQASVLSPVMVRISIVTIPTEHSPNGIEVWRLDWGSQFKGKLRINPSLLFPGVEW